MGKKNIGIVSENTGNGRKAMKDPPRSCNVHDYHTSLIFSQKCVEFYFIKKVSSETTLRDIIKYINSCSRFDNTCPKKFKSFAPFVVAEVGIHLKAALQLIF